MWQPTKAIQKMIGSGAIHCAWVYADGVALRESRRVKLGKDAAAYIEVDHIFPVAISLFGADYRPDVPEDSYPKARPFEIKRLVFHYPELLYYGIAAIRVSAGYDTQFQREKRIATTCVQITTAHGVKFHDLEVHGIRGGRVCVQPNPYDYTGFYTEANPTVMEFSGDHSIVYAEAA